ncbi:hypothetical protein GGQ65_006062 [Rhizobium fabae]|uniref:Uncharacterized protein n=1 Tax=Rhizobium fabae TaxID=573179 RepID=A0A7W6BGI5_9HYPH|nr:hypothetical protein [Rhizobium fabae]
MSPTDFATQLLLSKALVDPEIGGDQNCLTNPDRPELVVLYLSVLGLFISLLSIL